MTEVFRQEFEFWCAGTVVADHCLDHRVGVGEFVPETSAVNAISDGRAAFVSCVAVGYVFRGESKIVEACFCCDLYAAFAGFAEEGNGLHGGEVDDV